MNKHKTKGGGKIKEGWYYLSNSPKWHYFRDGRSLCGRWATFAKEGFEQGNDGSPDNCMGCQKKLLKEKGAK